MRKLEDRAAIDFSGAEVKIYADVYVRRGGRILMLERSMTKTFLPGWVIAPGGKVEPGEDLAEAAAREFFEETGLHPVGMRLRGSYAYVDADPDNRCGVIYLFVAEDVKGVERVEVPDGNLVWLTLEEILAHPRIRESYKRVYRGLFGSDNHVAFLGGFDHDRLISWADADGYYARRMAWNQTA